MTTTSAARPSIKSERNTKLIQTAAGIAITGALLGVLGRDLLHSPIDPSRIPPPKPPEGLYDTFVPGDLLYQTANFAGSTRAHYAVYVGKINGVHTVFDTALANKRGKSVSRLTLRSIEEAHGKGTSFARAARLSKTRRKPTSDELMDIVNKLNGKNFDWTGFEDNCESAARAIVNDLPISTQGRALNPLTRRLTKAFVSTQMPEGYRRFAVKSKNIRRLVRRTLKDSCWEGYVQAGMKRKGKREVPNCVPASSGLKKPRAQRDADSADDGKKYTKTVTNPETGRKNKVRYGAKGYTIAPGTDKGDRYCARSFGDMKSHGKDCSGADRNTPLCLSRTKWRCSGKTSRRDGVLGLARLDAPEAGKGKRCGESFIPRNAKCSKGAGLLTAGNLNTFAKVALGIGVIAGGAALAKHVRNRQKPLSMEEWRNSPQTTRNNPKLSPEDAQRITDEAIAGGQKWDVQERINARRKAELDAACGLTAGKLLAPTKFDALVAKPRCQLGEGAFGTYFVHTSGEYGIKLFRDPSESTADWEFDRLGKAKAAGVNVPEPLSINSTTNRQSDGNVETLVLKHMGGYQEAVKAYPSQDYTLSNAPLIVKLNAAREFRKLHTEGLAHGDIHGGNILVNPRSKRVALVDFGYSTDINDYDHPLHSRNGVDNLLSDLYRLPAFLGEDNDAFRKQYSGVFDNIEEQAKNYSNSWERYELAIKRYHDALEGWVLTDAAKPRSRFVRSINQPRIAGLTRNIVEANINTAEREMLASAIGQITDVQMLNRLNSVANRIPGLGLNRKQVWLALKPERQALAARRRAQPFGTPLRPLTTRRGQRPFTVPPQQGLVLSPDWED